MAADPQPEGDDVKKYYEKVLRPDEQLIFFCTLHPIVYWPAAVFFLLALVALALIPILSLNGMQTQIALYSALALVILALFSFISGWLKRVGTEVAVTNRRVIYKRGLVSRFSLEMNISKIETVDVEQSLWGRLFNYGNVVMRGTGGTFEPLPTVAHPLELRSAIMTAQ
jgi:uncharacterized membrane protein YdbT with pleckstrin-like domain